MLSGEKGLSYLSKERTFIMRKRKKSYIRPRISATEKIEARAVSCKGRFGKGDALVCRKLFS